MDDEETIRMGGKVHAAILRLQAQKAALLEALEAQEAYDRGSPNPWGHDCRWCGDCMERITSMRRAAIEAAQEE